MLKMKKNLILILFIICFSCGKDKVVLLPEIDHSEITEIKDVSLAYLFYDETKKDSVELNRKNLIVSTNWLVNVDKRLTLKQAIPHIKFIQDKKRNSSHKNEKAKNYFTCNDTSRKNLGFIEFTTTNYYNEKPKMIFSDISDLDYSGNIHSIDFENNEEILILLGYSVDINIKTNRTSLQKEIKKLDSVKGRIILNFNKNLKFQDYIIIKSKLSELNLEKVTISNNEFIY